MASVPALPAPGEPAADAQRERFRREALTLGNEALVARRIDIVLGVADALRAAGDSGGAAAFLQRAHGTTASEGLAPELPRALARLKVKEGLALEAASLLERAVDAESPAVEDFVQLSWAYLAAGRNGPARAATTRGLRVHPGASPLLVQAAEVKLVSGDPEGALTGLGELSGPPTPEHLRVRAEARIASGDQDGARADARALREADPDSPWGPLLLAALGGAGRSDLLGEARSLAAVDLVGSDAERAIGWAGAGEAASGTWVREIPRPPSEAPKQ